MENKVFCVECTDQPAEFYCNQCLDDYCEVCYRAQHRKGYRSKHTYQLLKKPKVEDKEDKKETNTTIKIEKVKRKKYNYPYQSDFNRRPGAKNLH